MNRINNFLLCCALLFSPLASLGQDSKHDIIPENVPHGISLRDWDKMDSHWQPYSTRFNIQKKDGDSIEGQLIWMNDSVLVLSRSLSLPNSLMNQKDYDWINLKDVASMKIRLGGQPYQGLIIGILAGVIPGFIAGAILAQGWTIIPAIILGAITAGGGGATGTFIQRAVRKQTIEIDGGKLTAQELYKLKKTALFPDYMPDSATHLGEAKLSDFENLVKSSSTLQRAFPVHPFAFSINTSLTTNSVRKRLQNWYSSPVWGPADSYYETRLGLEADLSRKMGKKFQAGILFQIYPGDISSSYFNKSWPEFNVNYSYNHHFKQTTYGIYEGWLLQPVDPYWATRLEATIELGFVVSDIYEHFYFNWNAIDENSIQGETFIQKHNYKPGGMLKIQASWYLIPGFSIDVGFEGFWIQRVYFNSRTVLPQTTYGPCYIPEHYLNFSNLQGYVGLSVHF